MSEAVYLKSCGALKALRGRGEQCPTREGLGWHRSTGAAIGHEIGRVHASGCVLAPRRWIRPRISLYEPPIGGLSPRTSGAESGLDERTRATPPVPIRRVVRKTLYETVQVDQPRYSGTSPTQTQTLPSRAGGGGLEVDAMPRPPARSGKCSCQDFHVKTTDNRSEGCVLYLHACASTCPNQIW